MGENWWMREKIGGCGRKLSDVEENWLFAMERGEKDVKEEVNWNFWGEKEGMWEKIGGCGRKLAFCNAKWRKRRKRGSKLELLGLRRRGCGRKLSDVEENWLFVMQSGEKDVKEEVNWNFWG